MGVDHLTFPTMSVDVKVSNLRYLLRRASGGRRHKLERQLEKALEAQARRYAELGRPLPGGRRGW